MEILLLYTLNLHKAFSRQNKQCHKSSTKNINDKAERAIRTNGIQLIPPDI